MPQHSRAFSVGEPPKHPQRLHTRVFSAPPNLDLEKDAIAAIPTPISPVAPIRYTSTSLLSSSPPTPFKPPVIPDDPPLKRKFSRLKPSEGTLLKISHFILLVLNLSLLAFLGITNHAFIFPTSPKTSLALRERGYSFFNGLVALVCFASIVIGWLNIYAIRKTFKSSPRARRTWKFWKKHIFPCQFFIPPWWFSCFPRRRTKYWPWKRPGGHLKLYKVFAFLALAVVASWGFLACLAFRDKFADIAFHAACERGNGLGFFGGNTPGWDLMAEIRSLNGGKVQYDGESQENEKWGTTSRITFYTKGKKRDYEMELVRRYDMDFGYGDWADGIAQQSNSEKSDDGFAETKGILLLTLSNFDGSENPEMFRDDAFLEFIPRGFNQNSSRTLDMSPTFLNSTSALNTTEISNATLAVNASTASLSPAKTPTPSPQPLSLLKSPFLSSADNVSSPLIMNPFPIYSPPDFQSKEYKYHSPYPPIQKIVYNLNNMSYHLFLTNTTAPGFPAIEEKGGFTLGPLGGRRFGIALNQPDPTKESKDMYPWQWEWPHYDWEMNDGIRWRWDDFRWNPKIPRKDAGICLPPRVTLKKTGLVEDVLGVFGVTRQCGVVRVCGVRKGPNKLDLLHQKDPEEGQDQGWENGGWKRDVEERWAIAVGLIAWEVERWTQCCLRGE